jgi:glycosyltransferase involved in cell wall biosynthesis
MPGLAQMSTTNHPAIAPITAVHVSDAGPRVAHVVQRLAVGGVETFALDFLRHAPATTVVYSLEGRLPDLIRDWSALARLEPHLRAFGGGGGVSPKLVLQLARALRRDAIDAVVLHHVGPLLYGGLAARLALAKRIIHVEHDAWHYQHYPRHAAITRWCERVVRPMHVAVSYEVAAGGSAAVPGLSYDVIAPGIDVGRFVPGDRRAARDRLGLPQSATLVGTVGRLVALKRQDLMIRALPQLDAGTHVVLAGSGPERAALEGLAAQLGLLHRVHFLGQRSDLPDVLAALDVFCLPSAMEGLPRALLEAQAVGLRVVASDVGDIARALYHPTGRLVPANDLAALVQGLQDVLALRPDPLGAHAHVARAFSWGATIEKYRALTRPPW